MHEERNRWVSLIKGIRQERGVGLVEAERIALAQPEWRRWVERQIESDPSCRKMALRHIRERGPTALIKWHGDSLKVC
jgi:hypothetical protein